MKKNNKKISQHKVKRAVKNKKRIAIIGPLSKQERREDRIRKDMQSMLSLGS
ncbi:hypothetical protein UFOVP1491_19 [uncultured Caudovirales phage]|uniref:Uncharacterized protein n=1 Tax=uncultured Caudovirales phage TaxID=2100421 RepID=A0A6J5QB04_9CAUD|nr:hypothetical protein UFOVP485_102 [uncultured Caudovirales phage]CAB4150922.1 hypothetical protein UFOVP575_54 [uncultured Caudovirales phage]CAB4175001.1 hypothetical protein UFOVP963_106 [uncultured Caudovirales phage]CAB4179616.1 hypothetical protein UFOVP1032_19 [uncultured Caudovirales phage]CAB4185679.1 hypothetical protein UFOVP1125_87 [uncultured Caudovirales phage]